MIQRRFSAAKSANSSNPMLRLMQRNEENKSKVIRGYAAVFHDSSKEGTEYWLWDDIVERIRPGAFTDAINQKQDVRGLFNHSPDWVLGRLSSGSLRISQDSVGLYYEIDENGEDPQWRSVAAKIDRGDVDGSSFAFIPTSVTWETEERNGKKYDVRWVNSADLFDVGPVTFPAYSGASSGRSVSNEERMRLISERDAFRSECDLVSIRSRVISL